MKKTIEFTKEQYESLMKQLYLGNWMINAFRMSDEIIKRHDDLEGYIMSFAKDFGLEKYIDYDKGKNKYYPSLKFEEDKEINGYINDYNENAFWDELERSLAARDLYKEYDESEIKRMTFEERFKKMSCYEEKYEKEFELHGVENVEIKGKNIKKEKTKNIYQFKIVLRDIKPTIWRVIQVPETYTFWDLSVAIQNAMGWGGGHLHSFTMKDPTTGKETEIGMPDEEYEDAEVLPEWEQKIGKWFTKENKDAEYVYDFGDNWKHDVHLEKIVPAEEGIEYPKCIYGERACPPEDCGSTPGYERILEILNDKNHKEYKETLEWLGGKYDPESFDAKEVDFEDPKERFKEAFKENVG